jgi:hypothetical protein
VVLGVGGVKREGDGMVLVRTCRVGQSLPIYTHTYIYILLLGLAAISSAVTWFPLLVIIPKHSPRRILSYVSTWFTLTYPTSNPFQSL